MQVAQQNTRFQTPTQLGLTIQSAKIGSCTSRLGPFREASEWVGFPFTGRAKFQVKRKTPTLPQSNSQDFNLLEGLAEPACTLPFAIKWSRDARLHASWVKHADLFFHLSFLSFLLSSPFSLQISDLFIKTIMISTISPLLHSTLHRHTFCGRNPASTR